MTGAEMADPQGRQPRGGTLLQTAKAVLWSFFGVRKRAHYEQDAQNLNPVHVIVMGLVGAALFVVLLLAIIKFVVLR